MLFFVSEKNRPLLLAKGVCHDKAHNTQPTVRGATTRGVQSPWIDYPFLLEASFGLRVLSLPASVCVCVSVCVCPSTSSLSAP